MEFSTGFSPGRFKEIFIPSVKTPVIVRLFVLPACVQSAWAPTPEEGLLIVIAVLSFLKTGCHFFQACRSFIAAEIFSFGACMVTDFVVITREGMSKEIKVISIKKPVATNKKPLIILIINN
jgi:hypothetical protein